MTHNKITIGYVIQEYDGPKCIGQEFVAGEVSYEDDYGEPLDVDVFKEEYQSFDMVQPVD